VGPDGNLIEGAIVANRYVIEKKLGQGGMAAVYRALDLELNERVAVKVFAERSDEQLIQRFKQELSLSRKLAHPNIVRLHDMGTHEGFKFITMELLEGSDLGALLGGKALELAVGLRYLIQACQGLAVAHEAGVVHRDIKPDNFFVTKQGVLKVMDFGIAKGTEKAKLTVAGFVAGTPAYMSPEQINNFTEVTQLSDIYALGIVAYEIFVGAVPFESSQLIQILRMHLMDTPVPPRQKNPAIPQELEALILRQLEKDPARRIQTCRELGARLQQLLPRPIPR
jgi:serine/threonine-protein kinase